MNFETWLRLNLGEGQTNSAFHFKGPMRRMLLHTIEVRVAHALGIQDLSKIDWSKIDWAKAAAIVIKALLILFSVMGHDQEN